MGGAHLVDMAKVDFIVSATRPIHPRYLHDYDRKFVLSAVMGQRPAELEAHLPAAMNYVRIATASRLYHYKIRSQELLWGKQKGLETLATIAQRSEDFRIKHLAKIRARTILPSQVLTAANLGDLGDPALLAEVERAYEEGRGQFLFQRNSMVFLVFLGQLAFSFGLAVLYLQRRRQGDPHLLRAR